MREGFSESFKEDLSIINPIHKIKIIKDYRGYKLILYLKAFANVHLGYLDNNFFGYAIPLIKDESKLSSEERMKYYEILTMEPQQAIDYYIDNVFFKNPVLEFDTFIRKTEYKVYVNALKMKKESIDEKNVTTTT